MENTARPTPEAVRIGGKAAALAALGADFPIPPWFAVPPDAPIDPERIRTQLEPIGPGPFAVRSSAVCEDGSDHSFAGQFESYLDVPAEEVPTRIRDVRDSARSERLDRYRREHGLSDPGIPGVLVQRMIRPISAGVAFSADPVGGRRRRCTISAVRGCGDKLVSGDVSGEDWSVDRSGETIAPTNPSVLTSAQARAVAALVRRCEQHFARPQDIEWAFDADGALWLLQSRPITTLAHLPDPDDPLRVWDNSNIAESYSGVTTPLTFSFARKAYENVYREFCRLMAGPAARVRAAESVFPQMLGLIRGRVYYNLTSWYRVLALLPGFTINRGFMEQMMGVKQPMPDEIVREIAEQNRVGRLADAAALVRTCAGLALNHLTLPASIRAFEKRLALALGQPAIPFAQMSGSELVAHYRDLERQLLARWDAPLVNDFFAMIYYGLLKALCLKWAGDESGSLQNDLLLDDGGIISAEPPRRIAAMARLAASQPGLAQRLADPLASTEEKVRALSPELRAAFDDYLETFGDRCMEELKLESPTLNDDPAALLHSIGSMALRPEPPKAERPATPEILIRNPLKRVLFDAVARQARERVRNRENLRFERTRLFGRVRTILREIGRRLHADGLLDDPADVFYLETEEVLAIYEGTSTTPDLRATIRGRRSEFERFRSAPPPPDRFHSRGPVHRIDSFESAAPATPLHGNTIQGVGASPGIVRGRARVVLDPRAASINPGEILVAQQTDPGWVVLFPSAAGLLVERGSLLSHSAIVSRELRLPCIVSLPGITQIVRTGDQLEMDGRTGLVTLGE